MTECKDKKVVIIGAGPSGLSACYELGKKKISAVCLEATSEIGGLSCTIEHNGFLFDIGGHGFASTNLEVISLWNEILREDLIESPQNIGVYYRNRFFAYPPILMDAIKGIGLLESFYCSCSLTRSIVIPLSDTSNMENWWINQYGRRFYVHFFKYYNEKVWGLPSNQMLCGTNSYRTKNPVYEHIKYVIKNKFSTKYKEEESYFRVPKYGAGQLYKEMAHQSELKGNELFLNNKVICLNREGMRITEVITKSPNGDIKKYSSSQVISSMPLSELAEAITPKLSDSYQITASKMIYRSLICVNLIIDSAESIPYTVIFINDPSIKMVRLECFKNWNKNMVPDSLKHSLTCEYFSNEGDEIWLCSDEELVALAAKELKVMNILKNDKIIDSFIIRAPKAYPILDINSVENRKEILNELKKIENLHIIGRTGTHNYYSMDKSILSGLKVAREIIKELTLKKSSS